MKYFDGNFFKFTLGFLCIISVSLFVIYLASNFENDSSVQTAQIAPTP